jgi:hypothetical protein
MIGAIAAVVGGTVVFGSNTSTLKQTTTDMKAAEARRADLISKMDLLRFHCDKLELLRKAHEPTSLELRWLPKRRQ